jgi:hypothetical protein
VEEILGVVNDVPLPNTNPPIEEEYQLTLPAVDVADKITVPLSHILAPAVALILGVILTVAVTRVREEFVHEAVATSAKKLVVEDIDGVINDVPVPRSDPPDEASYQLMLPALEVADNVTEPASQRLAPVTPVKVGVVFTVAVTVVRVALVQVGLAASTK